MRQEDSHGGAVWRVKGERSESGLNEQEGKHSLAPSCVVLVLGKDP